MLLEVFEVRSELFLLSNDMQGIFGGKWAGRARDGVNDVEMSFVSICHF
jgi:hypothetical protein